MNTQESKNQIYHVQQKIKEDEKQKHLTESSPPSSVQHHHHHDVAVPASAGDAMALENTFYLGGQSHSS